MSQPQFNENTYSVRLFHDARRSGRIAHRGHPPAHGAILQPAREMGFHTIPSPKSPKASKAPRNLAKVTSDHSSFQYFSFSVLPIFTPASKLALTISHPILPVMRKIHYTLYREESDYVAQCLDFDVSSFGETKEEALRMLKEAVELYLEK